MKIRTQFIVTMLLFGVLLLIVAVSVILTNQRVDRLNAQQEIVHRIERGAGDLSYLSHDYLLFNESQQRVRWERKFASFSAELSKLNTDSPTQQAIVENIKVSRQRLQAVFTGVTAALEGMSQPPDAAVVHAVMQVSWSRMAIQNQGIIFEAQRLERLLRDRIDRMRQRNILLIIALIVIFGAYFFANYLIVYRHTLKSIATLQAGTRIIGSGNLDFAVAEQRADEIGELSRAFNRMTANLKVVTASKAELEKEMAERRKAEEELARQHEWLRVVLSSIGDAVMATDTSGRISFLNPVAATLTGWQPLQAHGQPARSVFRNINERTHAPGEDIVGRVLSEGAVVTLANHTALVARDGREIPIEDSAAPIKDRTGNVIGVVIVFHDVTERRRARRALQESETKFRILADFAYNWEYWRGPDDRFLYVSASCERVTGYPREAFLQDPELHVRIIHPDDRARVWEHMREDLLHLEPCELEYRIVHRDGRQRWIGHVCRPVLDEQGQFLGRRASNRDITIRKEMETELRRSRDELEERVQARTAELAKLYEEQLTYATLLEQSNRDLGDFAHVASHDLQEPLRKIQTFADRLATAEPEALPDAQVREYLARIRLASGRMQALVLDLLRYSRISSNSNPFARFNLKVPVEEAATDLGMLFEEAEGRIEVGTLPEIEGDPVQMRQLFQNLIGNGLKFRSEHQPIIKVCSAASSGPFWEIHVEDNGIGFDEGYLEKIFKPFQRLHAGSSLYPGTGMGLAICRRIVERHGGSITARSSPGAGSTFIVRLPKKSEGNQARQQSINYNHRPST